MTNHFAPLTGVRVVDFSAWLPGRLTSSLLLGLGADVIGVMPPAGDSMRRLNPALCDQLDRGKSLVTLDLAGPEGVRQLHEVVRDVGVLLEGFKPETAQKLGLSYAALRSINPLLVMCSIPAYRGKSELANRPAHDMILAAFAGLLGSNGDGRPPYASVDVSAAFFATMAVLGGLRVGTGTHIEVPLADSALYWSSLVDVTRTTPPDPTDPGKAVYSAAGGERFAILLLHAKEWEVLRAAVEPDCDEDLGRIVDQTISGPARHALLSRIFATRSREHWVDLLSRAGLSAAPVQELHQALDDPYFRVMLDEPAGFSGVGLPIRPVDSAGASAPTPGTFAT